MIRLTSENTQKAVAECKQLKPRVKFIQDRLFAVSSANNSNVYHVFFDVQNSEKFGECEWQGIRARLSLLSPYSRSDGKHLSARFETSNRINTKGLSDCNQISLSIFQSIKINWSNNE